MATATTTSSSSRRDVKEYTYTWEGTDRNGRQLRGEVKAASETVVITNLRRQGVGSPRSSGRPSAAAARSARRTSRSSPASSPRC